MGLQLNLCFPMHLVSVWERPRIWHHHSTSRRSLCLLYKGFRHFTRCWSGRLDNDRRREEKKCDSPDNAKIIFVMYQIWAVMSLGSFSDFITKFFGIVRQTFNTKVPMYLFSHIFMLLSELCNFLSNVSMIFQAESRCIIYLIYPTHVKHFSLWHNSSNVSLLL